MSTPDPWVGRVVLGRYRILSRLARGGMGLVYLARTEGRSGFIKPVIVKRILSAEDDAEALDRFSREARIMSKLEHPNIVSVLDYSEEEGAPLMVLEYVHGTHLGRWRKWLRKQRIRLPVDGVLQIVLPLLEALSYAHTRVGPDGLPLDIVHRDATPSNTLIDLEGHVKLTDFGIARMGAETGEFKTESNAVRGQFPYLAPEVIRGRAPSASSDIYSVGVILHELLVGKNEFFAKDVAACIERVLKHKPTPVNEARQELPPAFANIVARAVSKDPRNRFDSAAEFADALRRYHSKAQQSQARLSKLAHVHFFAPDFLPEGSLRLNEIGDLIAGPNPEPSVRDAERTVMDGAPTKQLDVGAEELSNSAPRLPVVTAETGARPPSRRFVVAVAALLVMAAVAVVLAVRPRQGPRSVVVVDRRGPTSESVVDAAAPRGVAVSPIEAVTGLDAGPVAAAGGPDRTTARTESSAPVRTAKQKREHALTRAFAKRRRAVTACFLEHRGQVDVKEVRLRFTLAASGRVESVTLEPKRFAPTELGRCLTTVARSVKFDRQKKGLSFRIPIQVE